MHTSASVSVSLTPRGEGEAAVNADAASEETEAPGFELCGREKKRKRRGKKDPLTLLLGLVRDVAPICLIDAKVNKQGEGRGGGGEGGNRCINHLARQWI